MARFEVIAHRKHETKNGIQSATIVICAEDKEDAADTVLMLLGHDNFEIEAVYET